jgi:hypothetical protein
MPKPTSPIGKLVLGYIVPGWVVRAITVLLLPFAIVVYHADAQLRRLVARLASLVAALSDDRLAVGQ